MCGRDGHVVLQSDVVIRLLVDVDVESEDRGRHPSIFVVVVVATARRRRPRTGIQTDVRQVRRPGAAAARLAAHGQRGRRLEGAAVSDAAGRRRCRVRGRGDVGRVGDRADDDERVAGGSSVLDVIQVTARRSSIPLKLRTT